MQVKLIQNGVEDNEILTEYQKSKTQKRGILSKIISCVLCLLFLCLIGFTVFANVSTKISSDKIPSMLAFYDKVQLHVSRPVRWDRSKCPYNA